MSKNMNTGDRVTILPDARWGASNQPVSPVLRSNNEPLFLNFSDPDDDGDLHVKTADGDQGGYVHERFVKPYVEPTPSTPDYTFDPGGSVIDYASVQEGDTIAALTFGHWRIGVAEVVNDWGVTDSQWGSILAYHDPDTAEIRLLNRPEVKVDRVAVEALALLIPMNHSYNRVEIAEALVKAGVTAPVSDA